MIPQPDALADYAQWTSAVVGSLYGLVRFFAGRKETQQENADTIECHEFVLRALADPDYRRKLEAVTGKRINEQLSWEEAEAIRADLERRKAWPQNN